MRIVSQLKSLLGLQVENLRLSAAEKVTILLSAAAVAIIAMVLGGIVLLFVSIAVAQWIAGALGETWAFVIVAAFYVLLGAVIIVMRKKLIIDPIARFISKLFLS